MITTVDSIIHAGSIIPVVPHHVVLANHSLVIQDGKISDILPTDTCKNTYSAKVEHDLSNHVLIPGLINLHTHAAMSLMRGLADDLPLMTWLNEHIWPAEKQFVNDEFVYDGTLLACAEMLRGGTTYFNDMYFFPEAIARATLQAGMRANLGLVILEFPTGYATDANDYIHKGLATRDALKDENLISFSMAPHAPYTVSDKVFEKIITLSEQLHCQIHMHTHETDDEIQGSLKQYNLRPLERMQRLGLLSPNFVAVHAVHLTDGEIATLAEYGCHTAHCPTSNLKLASGVSPIDKMLAAGINIGIGTDGAASNNRLDMLSEIRLAALLAKGISGKADTVPAETALAMATINAARALGVDSVVGSLEKGKCADITAIKLDSLEASPCFHPASQIVYASSREHVSHVWVAGKLQLDNGNLTNIDIGEVKAKATYWQSKLEKWQ